jgi:O-antigen/teichoic acid export membrane protein
VTQQPDCVQCTESILSKFSASAVCVLLSRIVAFVALFGFNAVLARSLSPAEFGVFALLFSFATLTSLLGSFGMNRALVKVLAQGNCPDRRSIFQAVHLAVASSVVGGILTSGVAFFATWNLLPEENFGAPLVVALTFAAIVLVRNIHFVLAETARGFHETNWSNLLGGPSGGPATHMLFLVAITGWWIGVGSNSLTSTLTIYFACYAFTMPLLVAKIYSLASTEAIRCSQLQLDQSESEFTKIKSSTGAIRAPQARSPDKLPAAAPFSLKATWALAIPMMLTQSFGLTLSQADVWLAGALVIPASVAIYCAAQRMLGFLTIPLQISGTAIVAFIPDLIAKRKYSKLQEMIGLATLVSGVPGILIGTVLMLFPETILTIVFGDYYAQGAPLLQILVAGQLISVLTGPCELLLMMAGHQNKTLAINVIAAVAIFTLGPLGIYLNGITGLAVSICSVTAAQNLCNWILARRVTGIWTHFDLSYVTQIVSHLQTFLSSGNKTIDARN